MKHYLTACFLIALCLGCGNGSSTDGDASKACSAGPTRQTPFYDCYDYQNDDCTTEKHESYSLSEYCSTLLDESANHNCEHDRRMSDYNERCK
jgi:hypothetical protein